MMYWGFFRNGIVPYILKATGEEIEAVVTEIPRIGGRSPHPLRYKFTKDGQVYVGANPIFLDDINIGDTIMVHYMSKLPSINMSDYAIEIRTLSF